MFTKYFVVHFVMFIDNTLTIYYVYVCVKIYIYVILGDCNFVNSSLRTDDDGDSL